MKKFEVKLRIIEIRNRKYTIYAGSKEDVEQLIQATNFDFSDYEDEDEDYVNTIIDEVLEIKQSEG